MHLLLPSDSPRSLRWILVLSVIVRLAAIVPAHLGGYGADEKEYLYLARQMLCGNGFVDSNGELAIKTPLFPALLTLPLSISGSSLVLTFLLVALLGLASVLAGYHLAVDLWGDRKAALVAAGLLALFPSLVLYGSLLMSENLAIPLLLLSLLLARRLRIDQPVSTHALFGVVTALAALVRAVFVGLLPIMIPGLVLIRWRRRARPVRLLIAVGIWCAVLAPWVARNYNLFHAVVPVSSFGGRSLLLGNNPYAHGTTRLGPGFQDWLVAQMHERGVARSDSLNEVKEISLEQSIALEYMTTHPVRTAGLALEKAYVFWIFPLSHQSGNHLLQAILMACDILLYSCVLGGVLLGRIRRTKFSFFWIVPLFLTIVHAVLHAEARYRLPVVPIFCIVAAGTLAAAGLGERRAVVADRQSRVFLAAGLALLFAFYSVAGWIFFTGRD